MSERFLKGIFLIFGFCFFVQILWMIGANFGIAEPFCLVIGKNPLKCSQTGEIKAVAKQFCLGQKPFGAKKKGKKDDEPPFEQEEEEEEETLQGVPQGYVTQEQLRAQQQLQKQKTQ